MDVPGKGLKEKVIHLWVLRLTARSLACSMKYAAALCPAGKGSNTISFRGDTKQYKQTQESSPLNLAGDSETQQSFYQETVVQSAHVNKVRGSMVYGQNPCYFLFFIY